MSLRVFVLICFSLPTVASAAITRPTVQLSGDVYAESVSDEQAHLESIVARTQQLIDAADDTESARERIEYRLAAANLMLARECEADVTRLLYGIGDSACSKRVLDTTRRALEQVFGARAAWERYLEVPDYDGEVAFSFDLNIETLESFAVAMQACVDPSADESAVESYAAAARKLSMYLEDERADVASASRLWQGWVLGKIGRTEWAIRILPRASDPPHANGVRYDFFAKLLRCRYLAKRGAHAIAWRFLLTLEERSRDWFDSMRKGAEAGRGAMLIKFEICDAWSAEAGDATRAWCDETLQNAIDLHFPDDMEPRVARIESAIPLIVPIPDTDPEQTAQTTEEPTPPDEVVAPDGGEDSKKLPENE